ncbi:MAG: GtrA family protein [Ruminococcus sp.]|nr:GtrA family protein [Ruminococcus sp.]
MEKIKKLIHDHWEVISYLIFGVLTTVVSWISYMLFMMLFMGMGMNDELNIVISNVISWIFAVAFAFITNKLWVFRSKSFDAKTFWYELLTFVSARLVTLLIETGILFAAGLIFGADNAVVNIIMKVITSIIVVVLNYIFSKLIIFRKKNDITEKSEKSTK